VRGAELGDGGTHTSEETFGSGPGMHKLLRRQLRKVFGSVEAVPDAMRAFVEVVDAAYHQADIDRRLLERSLDLTSSELLEANRELREYADGLELRVADRTSQLRASNASLQREIAERRLAEAAIRQSEERYRMLFETSKDTIFITDPDGRLIDINPAGVELFGFNSAEELFEVNVGRDLYLRPEDRTTFLEQVAEEGFVRDAELALVRKGGEVITVLATSSAVKDETGRVVAFRGILRDVTDQRKLEQELRHAQKMEAVGRLAGGVAHDFNNLLTAIMGYSAKLLALPDADEVARSCAEAIAAAAERGAGLTGQLLAFSRRQVLQPTILDLNTVIAGMDRLHRRLIPEDVEILTELDPELASVQVDRTLLEQVILNLVINASDAMPEGGRLTIRTKRREASPVVPSPLVEMTPSASVQLSVEDTGVGIDEAIRDQIFDPFFTTKDSSRGTGLGLATVYSAVRQSGGYVEVWSEVGVGSRFDIVLPCVDAAPAQDMPSSRVPATTTGQERVLLVEDDPSVRDLLRGFLEELGYTVLAADNGSAGLEIARRNEDKIDLVVTDVVMPRMNGIELARHLRDEQPGLKVILMSGYTRDRNPLEDESLLGPDCLFLQKPFSTQILGQTIRTLLDER
jgi:two-component system, cell cycle sensor histidine kinase and response regulator CckA